MLTHIRPIRTEADYQAAVLEIENLWTAPLGTPEADRLDVLATLVAMYQSENYPIELPSPIAAIRFRMEQQGLKRSDLGPYLGGRSHVSEVLSGRRALSLSMIRKLHKGLGIPLEVLIQETPEHVQRKRATSSKKATRVPLPESNVQGLRMTKAQLRAYTAIPSAPISKISTRLTYARKRVTVPG